MKPNITFLFLLTLSLFSCNNKDVTIESSEPQYKVKAIDNGMPIIGLLAYDGVLMTEVTAPIDVFTKKDTLGKELFNVVIVAETMDNITTEEGLQIIPDYTFDNAPNLDVLFVPSGYDMTIQIKNDRMLDFIREQNMHTQYTVSNCAGAQLIGQSGIANGKNIVTWIGGGEQLQKDYPELLVQDDATVTFVEDGKFSSSNGNMASYVSSLELLEKMSSADHRAYVESYLYLDRLKNWE